MVEFLTHFSRGWLKFFCYIPLILSPVHMGFPKITQKILTFNLHEKASKIHHMIKAEIKLAWALNCPSNTSNILVTEQSPRLAGKTIQVHDAQLQSNMLYNSLLYLIESMKIKMIKIERKIELTYALRSCWQPLQLNYDKRLES